MKTQSLGRGVSFLGGPYSVMRNLRVADAFALKNYRDQRENGDKRDEPIGAFPAARFDALKIESSTYKPDGPNKKDYWPDKQGRYWWRLTLEDGKVSEDFYWMRDRVRGFPDRADRDRYWFSVHHAPSGTKIEGFSARPDREKGYPDKDGEYWSYIQYDECGPIKEWMEEKDRNYVARLKREKQPQQPDAAALRAAEEKQRQEQIAERLRLAEMKELEDRKIREESGKRAAETKRLEEQKRKHEKEAKKVSSPLSYSSSSSRPGFSIDSSFSIRYEDIRFIRPLGEGAFGLVSYGKWHYEDVAVKTLHLQRFSENALVEFREEAAIMARLRSDYIVLLKGVSLQPYALVMEYMPGGSLFNLLHSPNALPMAIRHRIALDVAKGLAFLHQHPPHGILHRDLKSQNVLLTEYLRAKLADFGLSKVRVESSRSQAYAQSSNKIVGTIPWMAPECFGIRPKYSEKSDMYAYGMVLWELISRRIPYEDVTEAYQILEAVNSGEREEIPEQTANPREEVPVSFKKVIRFCWFQEADKRPAAKDAIEALGDDIAISMPSPSSGYSSSSSSSGSSGGLPSGFISNFSSFKH